MSSVFHIIVGFLKTVFIIDEDMRLRTDYFLDNNLYSLKAIDFRQISIVSTFTLRLVRCPLKLFSIELNTRYHI